MGVLSSFTSGMNKTLKRILVVAGAALGAVVLAGGVFVGWQVHQFDSSMDQVYDVPVPRVERSTDAAVVARGQHLSESVAACSGSDCHGKDLAGGKTLEVGPLGTVTGPNITPAGLLAAYSDGELFRLIRHGLKKDGRSVRFMPSHEIGWLPDSDIQAIISYLRTVPAKAKPNGPTRFSVLAKILDRRDLFVLDVARRIKHDQVELASAPTPDAEYGRFLALGCTGCHGTTLSGGPIPGAPPDFPVPSNLTPHESGLKGWTYADFERLLDTGLRKSGAKLDPFMPLENLAKYDSIERRALWAYLQTLPAKPFGER